MGESSALRGIWTPRRSAHAPNFYLKYFEGPPYIEHFKLSNELKLAGIH